MNQNKLSIKYKLDKQNKNVLEFQFFKVWTSKFSVNVSSLISDNSKL